MQPIRDISVREHLYPVLSIAKYELIVSNLRYPLRIVTRFVGPLLWIFPFLLFGKAVLGGTDSATLYELTGISHMPTFILVGTIITSISFNMLWLMSFAIRLESFRGTFESIYSCPINKFTFFMGKLLASVAWSSMYVVGLLAVGIFFLDAQLVWSRLPDMILDIGLLFLAMYGFGLTISGFLLVYKESHTLIHFLDGLFSLIVPMAYPLAVLPLPLQKVSLMLPMTRSVLSSRNVMILGESIFEQGGHIAVLLAYIVVAIPLGYMFYMYMEKKAKKKGVLHKY
ncbi:MAG: ABC transporter permease [Candidatus Methanofastidiosa archaeon]|nr:ABC transporter permease [Candidatus Methanofastidiosa archaeon]